MKESLTRSQFEIGSDSEEHMKDIQKSKKVEDQELSKKRVPNSLEKIELDQQQIAGVLVEATTKMLASGLLSLVGLNKLLEWTESVDQASRAEKLKTLLVEYGERFDSLDEAISKLKLLTATRGGQTIFRKVIQIVDKGNEDQEWIHLLAVALKRISEAEFEKYFDAQLFMLSQIDRLSPQALILLSEYGVWREVNIQSTTTTSGQTMGDWIPQVTMFMRQKKKIDNLEVGARINHFFRELESTGMVDLKGHQLKLTAIGLEIHRAITEQMN